MDCLPESPEDCRKWVHSFLDGLLQNKDEFPDNVWSVEELPSNNRVKRFIDDEELKGIVRHLKAFDKPLCNWQDNELEMAKDVIGRMRKDAAAIRQRLIEAANLKCELEYDGEL